MIFSVAVPCHAQSLQEHIQKGDRYYLKKDYRNALQHFEQALMMDPENPMMNYKAGVSSIDQKKFVQAAEYLSKAHALRPDIDPDIDYYLGVACQNAHRYDEALRHFKTLKGKSKRFASIVDRKISECIAADSLMKRPPIASVRALEGDINTDFSEFAPLIAPDGQTLIFSSDRSSDAYAIKSRTNYDDVYVSRRQGSGWTDAQKIGASINVSGNEVATSLSADGNTLFLYYESGGGDIYMSTKENGEWTKPVALNSFINHPKYRETAASISPDGQYLYFSSNRPGGKGGFDLYVSKKGADGQWGRPSNLGSAVNTRFDEISPFIHSDGTTLYFASNGHDTLGDHDLFRTTQENGRWTTPENLGYPVNTSAYEGFLVLSSDGKRGFFTSRRKAGRTDADIYTITFHPDRKANDVKPAPGVTLNGTVVDIGGEAALDATLTLADRTSGIIVSRTEADRAGRFTLTVPRGGPYQLRAEKQGYLATSIDLNPEVAGAEEKKIFMVKSAVGSRVVLKNIFFDVNESVLREESLGELERIRDLLLSNPELRIRVNGHTDNAGHPEANRVLSLKRAQAVVAYLVQQGIQESRLEAKGFGADRPLVSNDDEEEGRQINRRTEIEILE